MRLEPVVLKSNYIDTSFVYWNDRQRRVPGWQLPSSFSWSKHHNVPVWKTQIVATKYPHKLTHINGPKDRLILNKALKFVSWRMFSNDEKYQLQSTEADYIPSNAEPDSNHYAFRQSRQCPLVNRSKASEERGRGARLRTLYTLWTKAYIYILLLCMFGWWWNMVVR